MADTPEHSDFQSNRPTSTETSTPQDEADTQIGEEATQNDNNSKSLDGKENTDNSQGPVTSEGQTPTPTQSAQ